MMHQAVAWLLETVGALGYPGILLLMGLESSFFPFPSEVVMIPAGVLSYHGEFTLIGAVSMGVLGSLFGAYFNYYLARRLGRPFIARYGRYVFLSERKLEKVEGFFARHGEITTFVGRLIPGVRQLISFPAGLGRMPLGRFTLYTLAGAGIWVVILVWVGYYIGPEVADVSTGAEIPKSYWGPRLRNVTYALVAGCLLLLAAYVWHQRRKVKAAS